MSVRYPEAELASRSVAQLRRIRVGVGASLVGVLASAVTSMTFVAWSSWAQVWPLVLVVGHILLAGICLLQWWVWRLAREYWLGQWAGQLGGLRGTSVAAHLLAWIVAVCASLAAIAIIFDAGWSVAAVGAVVAMASSVVSVVHGASQYLRPEGPSDTITADAVGRLW